MAEGKPINQQINQPQAMAFRDDEIDLAELFTKIWSRKWWVVGITLVITSLGIVYALLAQPTYELKATFRPALSDQFVELNQTSVVKLDPKGAFDRYRKNLESKAVRRTLFDQPKIFKGFVNKPAGLTEDQLFAEFDEELALKVPVAKKNQVLVSDANYLTFKHFDPEYGATVVNGLLASASRQVVKELKTEFILKKDQRIGYLEQKIAEKLALAKMKRQHTIEQLIEQNGLKIKNVQDKLEIARAKAKAKRYDRMEALEEAIQISKALNLIFPTTLSSLAEQPSASSGQMAFKTEINNGSDPQYFRGSKLLNAELAALKSRQNDDFTDPAIRELEGELELIKRHREVEVLLSREDDKAFIMGQIGSLLDEIESLKSQNVDFDTIAFYRIDQPAIVPIKPIKPKRMLIVAVALVLGGMLGLFIALVVPVRKEAAV